ncbi:MAG: phospho-2-dehydro-3-deoxyheptonate aldolase [Desulfatitalea sp. BRH_c12]|nr:MAG: phospho-2-dehydro-3-deoxyheptonate aldolase [Desulfatitalea sp. BRH_c12]
MILVLKKDANDADKSRIRSELFAKGCVVREMNGTGQTVIAAIGRGDLDIAELAALPGVAEVVPITSKFKLVGRQWHPQDSEVTVGPITIGGQRIALIAGPCAIESMDQALTTAREVKRYGGVLFRGGAFKPRTSPYSFQGMEEEGLKILAQVRAETGMPVVTEITSVSQADLMLRYVDMVQVGARNMQNFELLKCVGRMGKPVLLKRGLASTIEEWLMSAEYILAEGNDQVVLCERGIRTFEPYTRNTLDLSAIPVLKNLTHLPVVVDPSHATGIREKVAPMARAAIAAGADGLMVEVHHDPDKALSDGPQSLYPEQFGQLARDIYVIAPVVGKQLDFDYLEKSSRYQQQPRGEQVMAAYLGEPGSFSHIACTQYLGGEVATAPQSSFRAIFDAVQNAEARYGIIPLENSLTGSIHENYDLLLAYDLKIVGELYLRIIHHLMAAPGTGLEDVRRVWSAEPGIQQCRQFLDRYPQWELATVPATSSAVRRLRDGQKGDAAIGSREAAVLNDMHIIAEGIETDPRNFTRFVIVGKTPLADRPKTKSSIVFSTANQPGALFEVMHIFADHHINLVKLESRPIHGKPWQYMFYADIQADVQAPELGAMRATILERTEYFKVLGTY